MFCFPRCWCIFACCRSRHCFSDTRPRLIRRRAYEYMNGNKSLPVARPMRTSHVQYQRYISAWHKPLQPVVPSFTQPAGQSSHFLLPGKFKHLRLLSHPPFFIRHSFTSTQSICGVVCSYSCSRHKHQTHHSPLQPVSPSFAYPDGQLPHVLLPAVFVQVRLLSQPPLFEAHSLMSDHP